jgi:two-component system repressor protein LuxO
MRPTSPFVLLVEDTYSLAETYRACLKSESLTVEIAGTGEEAFAALERREPDLVLLDVHLPDGNGIEVLKRMRALGIDCETVVFTGQASISTAVDAMREGASDFLMKPFSAERLRETVRAALDRSHARRRGEPARGETEEGFSGFIGRSPAMQSVYRILRSAAPTGATVFVTGESGTGKELCAEALHRLGKRSPGPFVSINCAAIPRDLLESEIFGHAKGAFTGASADRKGAVLQAHGGTLFLDEICEMDLSLQAKMLRFLQQKTVQRVGEDVQRPADVRIVCATNRDPQAEVAAGRFREDLFYRLHVVPLEMPALRDRGEDILLIARNALARFAREDGKDFAGFSPEAEAALLAAPWPGNVRQLLNVVRNAVVLNEGRLVTLDMLPRDVPPADGALRRVEGESLAEALRPFRAAPRPRRETIEPLETVVRRTIEEAIEACGGSIPKAAAALDVSPSTLYRRIQGWQAGEPEDRAAG